MNYSSLSKLKSHINSSVVLIFFTILALVCANTPVIKEWYFSIWQLPMSLSIGEFNFFSHSGHSSAISLAIMPKHFKLRIAILAVFLFGIRFNQNWLVVVHPSFAHPARSWRGSSP